MKKDEKFITLTVEEAKGILWDLRDLYKQTYGYEWVKNEPWFDEFKKRIEQAEEFQKQEEIINLKCETEQLKSEQELDNWLKDQFLKVWRTSNESN